jgi:atypical dual specificity phosphatase
MKKPYPLFLLPLCLFSTSNSVQADGETESYYSSLYKKMKYEVSLKYTDMDGQLRGNAWWTKLTPYNIYLGALPLKSKGHLQEIADLGVTQVLAVVEDFELDVGYFNTPITSTDWNELGIGFTQIPAVDFEALTSEQIKNGVAELARMIEAGDTVYVHCKAGKGRSATIVIAYLMEHHMLSFDEAFSFVQNLRPQINLNSYQRQAIFDYFELEQPVASTKGWLATAQEQISSYLPQGELISEETLAYHLENMLHYVIEGVSYEPGKLAPERLAGWIPAINVESTLSRRNRYLREYEGNQEAATEAAITRNHSLIRRFKIAASSGIPFVGTPTSYSISLWHQLREIALIAAIHGHDLQDPYVKLKILSALAGGNLLKVPAVSIDFLAKKLVKTILVEAGIKASTSAVVPAQVIFNFFTDNAAKVSTHAKALFAGENSIPIPQEEYFSIKEVEAE